MIATADVTSVTAEPTETHRDLSRTLEQAMSKQSDEKVRCVRVFGSFYRCNWWQSDSGDRTSSVTTHKIVRSMFVRATVTPDGLQIDDVGQG